MKKILLLSVLLVASVTSFAKLEDGYKTAEGVAVVSNYGNGKDAILEISGEAAKSIYNRLFVNPSTEKMMDGSNDTLKNKNGKTISCLRIVERDEYSCSVNLDKQTGEVTSPVIK